MDPNKRLMGMSDTLKARAVGRSTHLAEVNDGRWTKPVKASAGRVAWPAYEVEAQIAARIAGKADDALRQLVRQLEAARQHIAVSPRPIDQPAAGVYEAVKPTSENALTYRVPKRSARAATAAAAKP